jgi:hypothetical protein
VIITNARSCCRSSITSIMIIALGVDEVPVREVLVGQREEVAL